MGGPGRPKTVAMLREEVLSHGGNVIQALVSFIEKHKATEDARMADVWERACEALLDRLGLVAYKEPPPAETPAKVGKEATPEELEAAATEGEA